MLQINDRLRPADLQKKINRLWELSAKKIVSIEKTFVLPEDANLPRVGCEG